MIAFTPGHQKRGFGKRHFRGDVLHPFRAPLGLEQADRRRITPEGFNSKCIHMIDGYLHGELLM